MDPNGRALQAVPGLYERVVTDALAHQLEQLGTSGWRVVDREVGPESAPFVLARHVGATVQQTLLSLDPSERVAVANRVLAVLAEHDKSAEPADQLVAGPRELIALAEQEAPGVYKVRPLTPLSESALLTNAPEEQSLGHELRAELATADRVDLLCAFVKWHGLRVIEEQLRDLKQRGVPLRVITTTYIGATERQALDRLVREFGAEVKVNYELRTTRLHAKAWLFRRATGYDTAYVGSSNLSKAALLDGLEWNVRLSGIATPAVLRKFEATFDSYWNNPSFKSYDPDRDADELDRALRDAGGSWSTDGRKISLSGLEVRPHPHQRDMLERLNVEREVHDRHRNLLVAATGTGKTITAALDYKALRHRLGGDPTLLFVAHREEILRQSQRAYREVLADGTFGELLVRGDRPERWRQVFASVQSLHARGLDSFAPDRFDVIVIDEFHHAEAATYRKIIDHFKPIELLGLTATPERADGKRVQDEFFDGRIAAEMRLWQALQDDLLCPFHYFGVHDNTDLSTVGWRQGAYDANELTNVLTAGDAQARQVVKAVRDKISNPLAMRALGFCVSVRHAQHMADAFARAGLSARALSGATPAKERKEALDGLRSGEIQVLFTVDLFNEGLDIPDVDTLLLLRPTSSATIFLQQLGRGLRRSPNKAVLTVLDFIGYQRKEFRFEEQFRALTGQTRSGLEKSLEQDFPLLPSGCQIVLDRVSKDIVLGNIKEQLRTNINKLAQEVRSYGEPSLATFLAESRRDINELYRSNNSWTGILRRAGLTSAPEADGEPALLKRVAALLHVDDPERVRAYSDLLADGTPEPSTFDERMRTYAEMLFFSLWPDGGTFKSIGQGLETLRAHPAVRSELRQVFAYGLEQATHSPKPLSPELADGHGHDLGPLAGRPLAIHAHYNAPELLAALRWASLGRNLPSRFREGVAWCPETQTDALLVTIRKDEKDFSENVRYHDYALSEDLFHWESQNRTTSVSPTGQRYQRHQERGSNVLLFVRQVKENEIRRPAPYILLGPARYVSHVGDRPMAVTWELAVPLPSDVQHFTAVTSG
nr:DEAD/DEAH box helicase [Kitasatospora atroaurantiaca]